MYRIVVPARYASSRLPGKALRMLAGKPMIQWVVERSRRSQAQQIVVATDDDRIANVARAIGADVQMTSPDHASGTDRIAEVVRERQWTDNDVIVNVQGDEPLMPPTLIDQVAGLLTTYPQAHMATLSVPLHSTTAMQDPNIVKVVTDVAQRALYFSRAPIPFARDAPGSVSLARHHLGIYAYRVAALKRLASFTPSPLEQLERLEQLRALENGMDIRVGQATEKPGGDVNTEADVPGVEALLAAGR